MNRRWERKIFGLLVGGILSFGLASPVSAYDTDDFYFQDFDADYYLSRDEFGVSHLSVTESLTAIFPDYPQNKGICRDIPFKNQNGQNITLPSLEKNELELMRNFGPEPIYSIDKGRDFYEVCTGDEDYVFGEQTYTFSYAFSRVITDFEDFQELYWDTNGNAWPQEFKHLAVRVHVEDEIIDSLLAENWCYVGKYGQNDQERCTITPIADGFLFETNNLAAYENLTFVLQFQPETFTVPVQEKSNILIYLSIFLVAISGLILGWTGKKYLKIKPKKDYYRGLFVKPEFQPHPKYSLGEMAELYLGEKQDVKTAMLLDLIVNHKVSLMKVSEKTWAIKLGPLNAITPTEQNLLKLINGGKELTSGQKINIKSHAATPALGKLNRDLTAKIVATLKKDRLVEENYRSGATNQRVSFKHLGKICLVAFLAWFVLMILTAALIDLMGTDFDFCHFANGFFGLSLGLILGVLLSCTIINKQIAKFKPYTKEGLKESRYMDGLKLYIKMAEKDRLAFLQSVEGAEVTEAGIVKLYEKLLPYAAVFGLEKSWLAELEQYCKLKHVKEPDWLLTGITMSEITSATRSVVDLTGYSSRMASSSDRMSSSGGSSSSSFSGGGGGGFSGGGGGGGGGHGR